MASSIRGFWRRLDGPVHPDDRPVFGQHPHTFNLDGAMGAGQPV